MLTMYKIHNLKRQDGSTYEGGIKNCLPSNFGILKDPSGKEYRCEWRSGEIDGLANVIYSDGRKFLGTYVKGKKSGLGCVFYKGKVYVGEFLDGNRTGYGELIEFDNKENPDFDFIENFEFLNFEGKNLNFSKEFNSQSSLNFDFFKSCKENLDIEKYKIITEKIEDVKKLKITHYKKGYFKDGRLHGFGYFSIPAKQYSFKGYFKEGYPSNSGIETTNLGFYKGNFENGLREGVGIFQGKTSYTGYWLKGKKDDYGIMKSSNGDIYEGFYSKGKKSGYGRLIQNNGEIFIGNYENSIRSGFGKVQRKGYVYIGEFDENEKDGLGYCKYVGDYSYLGEWKEGERSGLGYEVTKNDEYRGEFFLGKRHGKGVLYNDDIGEKPVIYEYGERVGEYRGCLDLIVEQFDQKKVDYFFETSDKKVKQIERYLKNAQQKLENDMKGIKEDFLNEESELDLRIRYNKKEFEGVKAGYRTLYDTFLNVKKMGIEADRGPSLDFKSTTQESGKKLMNQKLFDTKELRDLQSTQRLIGYKMHQHKISIENCDSGITEENFDFEKFDNFAEKKLTRDVSNNQLKRMDSFYNLCAKEVMTNSSNYIEGVDYDIKIKALEIEKLKLEKQKMELKNKKEKFRKKSKRNLEVIDPTQKDSKSPSFRNISVQSERSLSIFESNQFKHNFEEYEDLLYESDESEFYEGYESNFMSVCGDKPVLSNCKDIEEIVTRDNSKVISPIRQEGNFKRRLVFETEGEKTYCEVLAVSRQFYGKRNYKDIAFIDNYFYLSGKSGIVKLEKTFDEGKFEISKILQNINISSFRLISRYGMTQIAALVDNNSSLAILDEDLNLKKIIKHKKAIYESVTTNLISKSDVNSFNIDKEVASWIKGFDVCFADLIEIKVISILRGFFFIKGIVNSPEFLVVDFDSETVLGISNFIKNGQKDYMIHFACEGTDELIFKNYKKFKIFEKIEIIKKIKHLGNKKFLVVGISKNRNLIIAIGNLDSKLSEEKVVEYEKELVKDFECFSLLEKRFLVTQHSNSDIIIFKISNNNAPYISLEKIKICQKRNFLNFSLSFDKNFLIGLCSADEKDKVIKVPFKVDYKEKEECIQVIERKNLFKKISRKLLLNNSDFSKTESMKFSCEELEILEVEESEIFQDENEDDEQDFEKMRCKMKMRKSLKMSEIFEERKDDLEKLFHIEKNNMRTSILQLKDQNIIFSTKEKNGEEKLIKIKKNSEILFSKFEQKRGNFCTIDEEGGLEIYNFNKKNSKISFENFLTDEDLQQSSVIDIVSNSNNSKILAFFNQEKSSYMNFFSLKQGHQKIEYSHLFDQIYSAELNFYQNIVFVIGKKMGFSVLAAFNFSKKFEFLDDFMKKGKQFENIFRMTGTDTLVLKMENVILFIVFKEERFQVEKEFKFPEKQIEKVYFCEEIGVVLKFEDGSLKKIWSKESEYDDFEAKRRECCVKNDSEESREAEYELDGIKVRCESDIEEIQ